MPNEVEQSFGVRSVVDFQGLFSAIRDNWTLVPFDAPEHVASAVMEHLECHCSYSLITNQPTPNGSTRDPRITLRE